MDRWLRWLGGVAITLGVVLWGWARAQDAVPPQGDAPAPENIKQDQPSFLVRVEVNKPSRSYRQNDSLTITVNSEEDAYLYVVYKQADGKVYQIFPNSVQKDNRVKARQTVQIPSGEDMFRWIVSAPYGQETVTVLASKEPIEALSHPALRAERFNPVTPKQLKGVELELGEEEPARWAEDHVEITTYEGVERPTPGARRVGVFFGVSTYEFHDQVYELSGEKKRGLNLATCHRDARRLAEIMQEVGQLDVAKVFTNELATRAEMEAVITKVLPQITRPGDTVFIYFSGHGTQVPDDNGDEADGIDECLLPYDFLGPDVVNLFLEQAKENKLNPRYVPRVKAALEAFQRAGGEAKGLAAIVRQSAISDDLFGHWLQRLSGRQVVVLLDSCFSGGFAHQEKGGTKSLDLATASATAPLVGKFDFVESEVSRLKDLGQRDSAMLAASLAPQPSQVRVTQDLSVATYALVQALQQARGSVTLELAYESTRQGVAAYFDEVNRLLQEAGKEPLPPHVPYMQNYCTRPVLLKP